MSKTAPAKTVTYVEKGGGVFIVKNPNGVRFVVGGTSFREPRLICSADILQSLKKQNPHVRFLERLR